MIPRPGAGVCFEYRVEISTTRRNSGFDHLKTTSAVTSTPLNGPTSRGRKKQIDSWNLGQISVPETRQSKINKQSCAHGNSSAFSVLRRRGLLCPLPFTSPRLNARKANNNACGGGGGVTCVFSQFAKRKRRSSTVSFPVEAASPPTVLSNTSCFFSCRQGRKHMHTNTHTQMV